MSSDPNTHSEPIPISTNHRARADSVSDASDDSASSSPESPSHSPASSLSASLTTPVSASLRGPLSSPIAPTSPIMSYIYGSPGKNPFVPQNTVADDAEKEQAHTPHHRRMSTWVPVRFNHQHTKPANDTQQQRGAGIMRRLSLSVPGSNKPTVTTPTANSGAVPAKQDGGTKPDSGPPPGPRSPRRANLSPGSNNNKARAPSPMGERILKGHYDGF